MKTLLHTTYLINIIFFSIITIFTLQNYNHNNETTRKSNIISSIITITAMSYYIIIYSKREEQIYKYRYMDWVITTPLLLYDLLLIMNINDYYTTLEFNKLVIEITILNTLMLLFGYLGEINKLSMTNSMVLGFIPFIYIFYRINNIYTINNKNINIVEKEEYKIFLVFLFIWTLYGIVHVIPNRHIKDISYNILDLIAKGLFGLYIYWRAVR